MARRLAIAETAVRRALTAIEATGRAVKIETEIAQAPPIRALIHASASAAMVCLGAIGLRHFEPGRVGSTAAALAASAQCPVAIIRNHHDQPGCGIVVEIGASPDNDLLLVAAREEARVRTAVVHAVICQRTRSNDDEAVRDRNRRALADLDRRLARWRRWCPSVEVDSTVVRGSLVDYLASNRLSARMVIVAAHNRRHLEELIGPIGSAVLEDAKCSLLVVNRQHLLKSGDYGYGILDRGSMIFASNGQQGRTRNG